MKVYAYSVVQKGPRALEAVLARIQGVPLENRYFLGNDALRLETAGERNGYWFADFAAPRRGHGPGRMSNRAPLREIALEVGDEFGEDTGFAYDPATGFLAVQYNHYGPRLTTIEKYLFAADLSFGELGHRQPGQPDADRCGFDIGMVLKPDAYARLRRWGIYKSFDVKVAVQGAVNADLAAGRSLFSVLRGPLPEGVATVRIGIDAAPSRDGHLGEAGARGILNDVQRLGPSIQRAVVRGKPTEDDPMEEVNLVTDRISAEARLQLGHGLRYVREDRWEALARTLREWQAGGLLHRQR